MKNGRRITAIGVALVWVLSATCAPAATGHAPHKKASRYRPRAESKALTVGHERAERGATVAFTVLPGDTHAKLAADLTGGNASEEALRRIDPTLKPGETIKIPASILLPGLADDHLETIVFGGKYPTLWSVARLTQARAPSEVGRTARNLQRLNAILSADHLASGTKILVPKSWLEIGNSRPEDVISEPSAPEDVPSLADAPSLEGTPLEETPPAEALPGDQSPAAATLLGEEPPSAVEAEPATAQPQRKAAPAAPLRIHKEYVVRDTEGLDRRNTRLPSRLRQLLTEREYEHAHAARGDVGLVVVHTTEHRGSTFENTASYIRRKRLANYVIGPDGAVYEVVPEAYRAYGCGDSVWEGKYYVDLEAINIEIYANTDKGPHQSAISDAQYEGLRALLADIESRRPRIDEGHVVTHRMVALNFKTGTRSRKGDPFEFDWAKAGLPDNSKVADPDLLDGRAKICTDCRFTDRITDGQAAAVRTLKKM